MLTVLFARCYGGGATIEYRLKIGVFALIGLAINFISNESSLLIVLLLENYDERSFTRCKNVGSKFFCFVSPYAFDRDTD